MIRRAKPPVRKARPRQKSAHKDRDTLRAYGPPERREWVKTLPCAVCGVVGYSENAHAHTKAGMGRKGHYTTILPLCSTQSWNGLLGCHAAYDRHVLTIPNALDLAARVEARWQAHRASHHPSHFGEHA